MQNMLALIVAFVIFGGLPAPLWADEPAKSAEKRRTNPTARMPAPPCRRM